MERYGGGAIEVVDYDPTWPARFEAERAALAQTLGPLVVAIEHIGSTAVPRLPAKPIIDLLVGVRSLAEARAGAIAPLQALGYTYLPEYESWLPNEVFFRKGPPGPWTHHAHLMEGSNPLWADFPQFRDHLRAHPAEAAAYAAEKRRLATRYGDDIAGYRNGKHAFVVAATARARAAR
ncbi:MAG: GrpB family protein [Proteobacteria bacterium]|nr:GrpB family protein [Pseudomonadota bacterium]